MKLNNIKAVFFILILGIAFTFSSCKDSFSNKESYENEKLYTVSGSVDFQNGAYPSQLVAIDDDSSRSAAPKMPSYVKWELTATNSAKTRKFEGTISNGTYTIHLPSGTWTVTAVGNVYGDSGFSNVITTLKGSVTYTITETSPSNTSSGGSRDIKVKAPQTIIGKGGLVLDFEQDNTSVKGIEIISSDGSTINYKGSFTIVNLFDIPSGSYLCTINFYDKAPVGDVFAGDAECIYSTQEYINIFDNLTTDSWINNENEYFVEESGTTVFKITTEVLSKYVRHIYYVKGTGGTIEAEANTGNVGTLASPIPGSEIRTLISKIITNNDGAQYTIFIDGEISASFNPDGGSFIYINNTSSIPLNLKITGYNSDPSNNILNANCNEYVLATAQMRVLGINGTAAGPVNLILSDIKLTGGYTSNYGAAIYMASYCNVVLEKNVIIQNNCSSNDYGVIYVMSGSPQYLEINNSCSVIGHSNSRITVFVNSGTFTMKGGVITSTCSVGASSNNTCVYISDATTNFFGGSIYHIDDDSFYSIKCFGSNDVINIKGTINTKNNSILATNPINIVGDIDTTNPIKVTCKGTPVPGTTRLLNGKTSSLLSNNVDKFIHANDYYDLRENGILYGVINVVNMKTDGGSDNSKLLSEISEESNAETPNDYANYTINIKQDIKITSGWTPISSAVGTKFKGKIEGNGYTIDVPMTEFENEYGKTASEDGERGFAGFVGENHGIIQNVVFVDTSNGSGTYDGGKFTGSGNMKALQSSYNAIPAKTNASTYGKNTWGGFVGGITAINKGIIRNCWNKANFKSPLVRTGGIAGWNFGVIENCVNTGNIGVYNDNKNKPKAGGIAGVMEDEGSPMIMNCVNYGIIGCTDSPSNSESRPGAICGEIVNAKNTDPRPTRYIRNCYYRNECVYYEIVGKEYQSFLLFTIGQYNTNESIKQYLIDKVSITGCGTFDLDSITITAGVGDNAGYNDDFFGMPTSNCMFTQTLNLTSTTLNDALNEYVDAEENKTKDLKHWNSKPYDFNVSGSTTTKYIALLEF